MSIRLRRLRGEWVALCAAEHPAEPHDVYLDDGQHYALAEKFMADWRGNGLMSADREGET